MSLILSENQRITEKQITRKKNQTGYESQTDSTERQRDRQLVGVKKFQNEPQKGFRQA